MLRILKNKKGFTLIELVIIIILVGLLAAIAIPRYVDLRDQAVRAAAQATLDAGRAAINLDFANKVLGSGYTTDIFPSYTGTNQVITASTDLANLEAMLQSTPNYPPQGSYNTPGGSGFRWVQRTDGTYAASNPQPPVLDAVLDTTCTAAGTYLTGSNDDCWVSAL
jgi:prepilin-type N-terminal cleavage/methylation domain-containing protein